MKYRTIKFVFSLRIKAHCFSYPIGSDKKLMLKNIRFDDFNMQYAQILYIYMKFVSRQLDFKALDHFFGAIHILLFSNNNQTPISRLVEMIMISYILII